MGVSARVRQGTISGVEQYTSPITLSKGAIVTITGTFVMTLTLQRKNKATGAWVDVTSNGGTPVTFTTAGTPAIDPYMFNGDYRIGCKTGGHTSGSAVVTIEGR